jgi:hypothetical protein
MLTDGDRERMRADLAAVRGDREVTVSLRRGGATLAGQRVRVARPRCGGGDGGGGGVVGDGGAGDGVGRGGFGYCATGSVYGGRGVVCGGVGAPKPGCGGDGGGKAGGVMRQA